VGSPQAAHRGRRPDSARGRSRFVGALCGPATCPRLVGPGATFSGGVGPARTDAAGDGPTPPFRGAAPLGEVAPGQDPPPAAARPARGAFFCWPAASRRVSRGAAPDPPPPADQSSSKPRNGSPLRGAVVGPRAWKGLPAVRDSVTKTAARSFCGGHPQPRIGRARETTARGAPTCCAPHHGDGACAGRAGALAPAGAWGGVVSLA